MLNHWRTSGFGTMYLPHGADAAITSGKMCSTTGGCQALATCTSLQARMLQSLQELVR